MAGVMASLRGDAPIVRLNLKVLEPPPHNSQQGSTLHRSSPQRPRSPLPLLSPRDSTPPRSGSRHARTPPRSGRFSEELRARFTSDRGDKDRGEASLEGGAAKGAERGEKEKDKGTPMLSIGPISLGRRKSSPGMSALPIAEHEVAVAAANGDGSDSDRQGPVIGKGQVVLVRGGAAANGGGSIDDGRGAAAGRCWAVVVWRGDGERAAYVQQVCRFVPSPCAGATDGDICCSVDAGDSLRPCTSLPLSSQCFIVLSMTIPSMRNKMQCPPALVWSKDI
eukprot:1158975-Pelagomonas_calceolata.AAC.16